MILAVDVHYQDQTASVAGVVFDDWSDQAAKTIVKSTVQAVAAYEPGQFYKRELPCVLKLIEEHNLTPDYIVIDGYVYLDANNRAGFGVHLHQALAKRVPVIGVAKNPFKGISSAFELYRGSSKRPLYITSIGISPEAAKNCIHSMHGEHRMPVLLKLADSACRESEPPPN